jgi:hypothetical protein
MTTYRRTEVVQKTIRYEYDAPVDAKTLRIALAVLQREFKEVKGREVEYDDDYWVEPTDDGIAVVFQVEERKEGR